MDRFIMPILIVTVIALTALTIYASLREQEEWDAFAKEHACQEVGYKKGQTGVGNSVNSSGSVGIVTVTTPDQVCFKCDDGKIYWRDK